MGKEKDRFEKVYSQGAMNVMEIWVDKETGVYLKVHSSFQFQKNFILLLLIVISFIVR